MPLRVVAAIRVPSLLLRTSSPARLPRGRRRHRALR
jgi:hypothetical protein